MVMLMVKVEFYLTSCWSRCPTCVGMRARGGYGEMGETPSRLGGRELELYSSLWEGRELRAGLFRISRLSDDQDFRAYSTGDARWFQRLHEKDIKGSYTDSRID